MLFNSIEFAIFLPIVFALYWLLQNKKFLWQNFFLAAVSFFFYGWWNWRFLFLLAISATIDFITAFYIDRTDNVKRRKMLVGITLASNLGILGYFKYCDFFVGSFAASLELLGIHSNLHILNIVLPVGISFYTFQSIAYVIDVYRKEIPASKNYITFMAFVSFFPQLVAGPISRAKNLLTQFTTSRTFNYELATSGMRFILLGLFKKIVIADNLAKLVDEVYNSPAEYSGIASVVATLFFAMQIYCDFSGYSDIAVGVARLFGFNLVQNFRTPYFSTSLREFWQRWHISLSTWFRDYLYIPLGGNRVSEPRKYFNLFITFLISGLWHGANWTFVIWGAIHGTVLMIEEFLKPKVNFTLPTFVKQVITLLIVCFAWIFFRAHSFADAATVIRSFGHGWSLQAFDELVIKVYLSWIFFIALLVVTFGFLVWERKPLDAQTGPFASYTALWRIPVYYLLILLIIFMGLNDSAPTFIYFKF